MAVKAQDDSFSDLSTPKSPNSTTEKSTSQTHPPTSQNQDLLHDSHYHTRHNQHKHMHDAVVTETISVKDTQNDVCTHIFHEASETQPKVEMQPVTTESGRGRSRIIRKGGRSSSAESSSSTQSLDQDAAIKAVIDLVLRYSETGDYRELARTARDTGIPEHLRRIVWPILLANHPFVKEKSLVKEYRHSEDSYIPREIPIKRIRAELGRYHRKKSNTPSTRNGSPPSVSPSVPKHGGASTATVPTDPATLDKLALDTAVEDAVVSFLQKHDGITYARGMVYVCLALAECIFTVPSRMPIVNTEMASFGLEEAPSDQANLLVRCFEQMMCIMLWSPTALAPTGRMEGITEQRISTFLTECRQLIPELCGILDEEEALGFEEEWVQSWVQWWGAKEVGKTHRSRLWDWYLGYQKPELVPGTFGKPKPDEGYEEAFSPLDWHILVCVSLLKCLHDHVDDLEQSEIRSLLSNIPDRQLGSMSKIIEQAKKFRSQLRDLRAHEDEEYAANHSGSNKNKNNKINISHSRGQSRI